MADTLLTTKQTQFKKALEANSQVASIATKSPVSTLPTTAHKADNNSLTLVLYATGADNSDVKADVVGWRPTQPGGTYIPVLLASFSATIGGKTGVAGLLVEDTERFADTLSADFGGAGVETYSPQGNEVAHALIDLRGCTHFEIVPSTEGNVTDINALVATL